MKNKLAILFTIAISFSAFTKESTDASAKKPPLFLDQYCTNRGDNRCFENYIKTLVYTLPNRCETTIKGMVNIQFTIDSKGWITKAKYKGGSNELCDYYQEEIEELFLNSPKWIPARQNGANVEHTMMIVLNFT